MGIWLDYNGYIGAGKLFAKYSAEEQAHAEKAYGYLLDLDIQPSVPAISKPVGEYKSLPEIIDLSYKHELEITRQCQELAKAANTLNDFMTLELAQWYLTEQVEEIAKTSMLKDRLEAFGEDKIALRMLDKEMGEL